jgi:hypothetical protein
LQELKKLKSSKPKYIKETLLVLPLTLDETYERMLTGIHAMFRREAQILLLWLAYAQSPPTLGGLAEGSIIDPAGRGGVDVGNRGGFKDTLEILSGLVTCGKADNGDDSNISDDIEATSFLGLGDPKAIPTSTPQPSLRVATHPPSST